MARRQILSQSERESLLALPEGIDRTIHQNRLLKLAREGRKMSSRDLTRFSAADVMQFWCVSWKMPELR